tara:strand:+ start:526 stop:891 length:366 start_codon:yes stop_codon:yes gene_type:complete
MGFWFLIAGAILSFVGMLFHGVAGQKKLMTNVYKSDMEPLTKSLILVSWHIYTIFLFISSATLVYVAYFPDLYLAIYPVIGVNILGAALFILLGLGNHKALLTMPGAYLMGGTALLVWMGI